MSNLMPNQKQEDPEVTDAFLKNQMTPDRFIGEVIMIIAPKMLHIDIDSEKLPVNIKFSGTSVVTGFEFKCERRGRTIGSALRAIREQLRVESGR